MLLTAMMSSSGNVDCGEGGIQLNELSIICAYKKLAADKAGAALLVRDGECVPALIYLLDDQNSALLTAALETLVLLTANAQHASLIRTTYELTLRSALDKLYARSSRLPDHLKALLNRANYSIFGVSQAVSSCDGTDTGTSSLERSQANDSQPRCINPQSATSLPTTKVSYANPSNHVPPFRTSASAAPTATEKSRSVFGTATPSAFKCGSSRFIVTSGKAKTLTFQLSGVFSEDNKRRTERILLREKGVVSIYFDSARQRCVLRTKVDVKPEQIANAIEDDELFDVQQVIKNEYGNEILVNLTARTRAPKSHNSSAASLQDLPDYLPEEYGSSPPKEDQAKAIVTNDHKFGAAKSSGASGWLSGVARFVTDSFYW